MSQLRAHKNNNIFLLVALSMVVLISGCSKKAKNSPAPVAPIETPALMDKTISGVTVRIEEESKKAPVTLKRYKQLHVTVTNNTDATVQLPGNKITLPLASLKLLRKEARGFRFLPTALIVIILKFGVFLPAMAINYQLSKVGDERRISKRAAICIDKGSVIDIPAHTSKEVDLFIGASYLPTFSLTINKENKPLVFTATQN